MVALKYINTGKLHIVMHYLYVLEILNDGGVFVNESRQGR